MKKETAYEIKNFTLKAIKNLSSALNEATDKCSQEDFEKLKKAIGMSIIKIDSDVLSFLYEKHPELDDLKNNDVKGETKSS